MRIKQSLIAIFATGCLAAACITAIAQNSQEHQEKTGPSNHGSWWDQQGQSSQDQE